jgi:hypothetical protein
MVTFVARVSEDADAPFMLPYGLLHVLEADGLQIDPSSILVRAELTLLMLLSLGFDLLLACHERKSVILPVPLSETALLITLPVLRSILFGAVDGGGIDWSTGVDIGAL